MRKTIFVKLFLLCCGVLLASGAFAADPENLAELRATIEQLKTRLDKLESEENKSTAETEAQEKPAEKTASGFFDSVFTKLAPKFGGDANVEYDTRDSNQGDGLTSRVRLTMDVDIDPRMYLHTRLTAKQYISGHEFGQDRQSQAAGYENEAIDVGMEQLFLGYKLGPRFNDGEIKAGRQPLWLADGILADINGINGLSLSSSLYGVNGFGFYGRNGTQDLRDNKKNDDDAYYSAVELSRNFGPLLLGGTFLKVDDNFYGAKVSYDTPFNTVLSAQYVINDDANEDDEGFRIKAIYGNAAKKGEWDASLAYLRIEDSINPNGNWFVNDGNWVGAEGFRIKAHYAVTDWSTLVLVQDFFDNVNSDKKQNRTDIEFEVRF